MKHISIRSITAILFFFAISNVCAQIIAIKAGIVIDTAGGTAHTEQIILVEDSKIKAVGANVNIPADADVIDLSDQTVLPGLFDVHTHLCASPKFEGQSVEAIFNGIMLYSLTQPTAYRALQGAANAAAMLEAGFTTVRDVGNAGNYADVALRQAIKTGLVAGPRFIISGKIISPFGGQFQNTPEYPDLARQDYIYADTHDEIRKAIRQNIHFGADWIKIVIDDQDYEYSADDIEFIVAEAKKANRKVAAHCGSDRAARRAILSGVASIEHGTRMSDETLALAKKNQVVLVGTDFSEEVFIKGGAPEEIAEYMHSIRLDRLKRAHKIGVTMAFGSDVAWEVDGHSRGSAALTLIDTWVEAGISEIEILQAFTINSAQLLGVEKKRGQIQPGMSADIIATRENPLKNIQTLKQVIFVMKGGKVIKALN